MASDQRRQQREPQPTLLDLLAVFVCTGAIVIFLLWISYTVLNFHQFDDLPPWLIGSYGFFTALTTGGVGLGAAILSDMTRPGPRPSYIRLFIGAISGAFLLIAIISIVVSTANEYVNQQQPETPTKATQAAEADRAQPETPPEAPEAFVQVFKIPDVSLNGTMREIQVTVRENSQPDAVANFLLEYRWTGSGGTQQGSQGFNILFKGGGGATLGSFKFPIDRSHCYYGGGNYEQRSGALTFDPRLIERVQIILSEVTGRMGAC